jgi:hypothetical protein
MIALFNQVRQTPTDWPSNPYRRLAEFTERDEAVFFGRENELALLLDRVCTYQVVTLLGESNVGKTSLLRAGLIPVLSDLGYHVIYAPCVPWPVRPIDEAVEHVYFDPLDQSSLFPMLMPSVNQSAGRCVVILDQAEGLFTRATAEAREQLIDELANALKTNPGLKLIVALRQDLARCLFDLSIHIPSLCCRDHTVHLSRLRRDSAFRALARPAEQTAFPCPPEVVQASLNELRSAQGYFPSDVQILGSELFEFARRNHRSVTLADYDAAGGARAIINQFYAALVDP